MSQILSGSSSSELDKPLPESLTDDEEEEAAAAILPASLAALALWNLGWEEGAVLADTEETLAN